VKKRKNAKVVFTRDGFNFLAMTVTVDERLDDIDMFSDTASMATTRITGSIMSSRASGMTSKTG
jgi:hypothetical protein